MNDTDRKVERLLRTLLMSKSDEARLAMGC